MDRQIDKQTDRQTDEQTDIINNQLIQSNKTLIELNLAVDLV